MWHYIPWITSRDLTVFSPSEVAATCVDGTASAHKSGLSAKNVGAKKLSMNVATVPPGGVAYAHIHVDFEE